MSNPISQIDQKILHLKQKKEKLQTQQAITFLKEAQKIFEASEFSMELALSVLSHTWKNASDKQKEEWKTSSSTFRKTKQNSRKTALKRTTSAS